MTQCSQALVLLTYMSFSRHHLRSVRVTRLKEHEAQHFLISTPFGLIVKRSFISFHCYRFLSFAGGNIPPAATKSFPLGYGGKCRIRLSYDKKIIFQSDENSFLKR